MRPWLGWWLLCLSFAASCASELGAPRIILVVDSDLAVPLELDRVTVEVEGQTSDRPAEADLRTQGLPRTVTLAHTAGPLGPVRVTVRGWLGPTALLSKQLALYFRTNAEQRVLVALSRDCLSVVCAADQTCERGRCEVVPLDPADRDAAVAADGGPAPDGDAGASDGGPRDAGPVPARDAGGPGAVDGSVNLPRDAGTATDAGVVVPAPDTGVPVMPPNPGSRPVCTIERPVQNDMVQTNTPLMLRGTCTDAESGPVTAGLSWASNLDGMLATGGATTATLRSVGRHRLTLCAPDPRDATRVGCSNTVDVFTTDVAQPSALIVSISQSGSDIPPFVTGQAISLRGAGTGAGVTLTWSDSLQGDLGTGTMVNIQNPLPGQHTVTLTVRDRDGKTATRTASFMVRVRLPNGMPP